METRGAWIIEVAELDTMTRAEVSTIKAFMFRTHDRFRPPYGKRLVDLARQCVFAGSINPEGGYLKDATGGRRFWPIACGTIDLDALQNDRNQLWAEARERFRRGDQWWLQTRELDQLAAEQQAERYQGDAWRTSSPSGSITMFDGRTARQAGLGTCRGHARPRRVDSL